MNKILIIFILLFILCIINNNNNNNDKFSIGGMIPIIVNKSKVLPFTRKYKFYDLTLFGPSDKNVIYDIYDKNVLKMGMKKYSKNGDTFKLNDFKPAKINGNYKCSQNTKRCDFVKENNYITPPCCASHLYELLKFTTNLFHENNIDYIIIWGTLLGSIRHGGLIPWDTDIDIGIYKESFIKILNLNEEFKKKKYKIVNEGKLIRIYYSDINLLHIDIFEIKEL